MIPIFESRMVDLSRNFSIYVHYPFCRKKCPYCHFFVLGFDPKKEAIWGKTLLKEWSLQESKFSHRPLTSLYFGGGTPFLLDISILESLLDQLAPDRNIEITMEMNPEDASLEKLKAVKRLGVNRLSVGVQSFDDTLLRLLGREHSSKKAVQAVEFAHKAGFENITIDLMYDVPKQTPLQFQESLELATSLPIQHVSLYNLTIEPGTAFDRRKSKIMPLLPHGEDSLIMLEKALQAFATAGWERYEISAFCKEGYRSIHNLGYWQGREFVGLGPSAFSYLNKGRRQNVCHFPKWVQHIENQEMPIGYSETLPYPRNIDEMIAIGIRVKEGIKIDEIEKSFGSFPPKSLQKLEKLCDEGSLMREDNRFFLTEQGKRYYDDVATAII